MTLPAQPSARVAALLKKIQATRGRLIFALDATASREPMWDMAAQLQAQMFEEAARIGGLDVQLVYYRGHDEVRHSSWFSDAHELVNRMQRDRVRGRRHPDRAGAAAHPNRERARENQRGDIRRRRGRGAATGALRRRGRVGRAAVPVPGGRRPGALRRSARRIRPRASAADSRDRSFASSRG